MLDWLTVIRFKCYTLQCVLYQFQIFPSLCLKYPFVFLFDFDLDFDFYSTFVLYCFSLSLSLSIIVILLFYSILQF